ncbi:MAG TPA: OB-fold domain-containing protein [Aeromicrobium sp.]|nr:OB-fold domain-containing protein [Aeromicrobium sp.]
MTTTSTWVVGPEADPETVATMTFRVLKFKPGTGRPAVDRSATLRPVINRDTQFFWDGTAAGELRVQTCDACGELRHPPGPVCPSCHAMDRGYVVASGRGSVHSFLVHHAPQIPGKTLPLPIALVDLVEGVRMVGEVDADVQIGDDVEVWFDRIDDDLTLAKWHKAGTAPEVAVQEDPASDLPPFALDITPTFVVSTALATRDFQDVHHDRVRAQAAGSRDIFINILTTTGLVQRYVTDWAGPDAQIRSCALRLGAPAYPGDRLQFSGVIVSEQDGITTIDVTGRVSGGDHVTARVELTRSATTSIQPRGGDRG